MPDLTHWTVFIGATSVLLITPGPSVMYVAARAIAQGWRAAVLSSIGLALGDTLQVIGTAFGLSAALVSAPWLFMGLKLAGAGYLVSLGTYTLMGKNTRSIEIRSERVPSRTSSNKLILQGFLALNPKTTLFFLAFLPQFIALGSGSIRIQILEFGITFAILGMVTNALFGCAGARLGVLALNKPSLQTAIRHVSGGTLIAIGIGALLVP
jgi:threonine/homoserine/homoserine lactone efflux protein